MRSSATTRHWLVPAVLAAALAAAGPRVARAEESAAARAATIHREGIELYQAGDYAGAAERFLRAQELAPAPSNLFNLARCYEQLGDVERAIEVLEVYVADPALEPERRARGQQELARLTRSEGQVEVTTAPPGAELFVDGRPQGPESLTPATLRLPPGEHIIEARLAGHEPVRQEVTVAPGGRTRLDLDLGSGTATVEGGEEEEEGSRVAWTAVGQLGLGASLALINRTLTHSFIVGFDVGAGLNLGRPRRAARDVVVRPVRLEAMLGVSYLAVNHGNDVLLEAIFTGRLGIALGRLPVRIEGEIALGLGYSQFTFIPSGGSEETTEDYYGLVLIPAVSLAWQPLRWLEVAIRPLRLELFGLAGDYPQGEDTGFALRYSLDVQVRFRY